MGWIERWSERCSPESRFVVALALGSFFLLGIGFVWFQSSGTDDSYITYGAASALLETGSISNYSGEAVEQSSSLLSVLSIAALAWVSGLDVPFVGWWLSVAAAIGCLVALGLLQGSKKRWRAALAMAWLALCGYFSYWAMSGMETTLVALTATLWVACHAAYLQQPAGHRYLWSLISAALFLSVRPEAPFISCAVLLAAVGLYAALRLLPKLRSVMLLLVGNVALAAIIAVWRTFRFSTAFPQPVYAKSVPVTSSTLLEGWEYISEPKTLYVLFVGLVAAGVGLGISYRRTRELPSTDLLALLLCFAVLAFSVLVGGDWMEGARFLCPILPLACFAATGALALISVRWLRLGVVVLASVILSLGAPILAMNDSTGVVAWAAINNTDSAAFQDRPFFERRNRVHVRDVPPLLVMNEVVQRLVEAKRDRVWLMTGQGGMVVYHTIQRHRSKLGVIDRRGLLDRVLIESPTVVAAGRERWGLKRRYDHIFDRLELIQQEIAIPLPDIVYDLRFDSSELRSLLQRGYVPVFEQAGALTSTDSRFPGRRLNARQTIFVQRKFLDALADLGARAYRF